MHRARAPSVSIAKSRSETASDCSEKPTQTRAHGERLAIDRVTRSRQSARTERADIDARQRPIEPKHITLEHLDIRQAPMPERHGLGRLKVRVRRERVAVMRSAFSAGLFLPPRSHAGSRPPRRVKGEVRGDWSFRLRPVWSFCRDSRASQPVSAPPCVHILGGLDGWMRNRIGFLAQQLRDIHKLTMLACRQHAARAAPAHAIEPRMSCCTIRQSMGSESLPHERVHRDRPS